MSYPENPALLAAVIADAEDDAPRLVYADWLDEHGDEARAAFIRNQCALFDKSPADPDYVDRTECMPEIHAGLFRRRLGPKLPGGSGSATSFTRGGTTSTPATTGASRTSPASRALPMGPTSGRRGGSATPCPR
jgi:uncharacterized protein (TIGR02996 family)